MTDFREACCRQNETNECNRGGFCNFMHLRYASPSLVRDLQHELAVELRERKRAEKEAKKGWKEREDVTAAGDAGGDVPSWKKAKSGGDWRRGSGSMAVDTQEASRDPYAGGNHPTGADGPDAGSMKEYRRQREAANGGGREEEKMRGWRDGEGTRA